MFPYIELDVSVHQHWAISENVLADFTKDTDKGRGRIYFSENRCF